MSMTLRDYVLGSLDDIVDHLGLVSSTPTWDDTGRVRLQAKQSKWPKSSSALNAI